MRNESSKISLTVFTSLLWGVGAVALATVPVVLSTGSAVAQEDGGGHEEGGGKGGKGGKGGGHGGGGHGGGEVPPVTLAPVAFDGESATAASGRAGAIASGGNYIRVDIGAASMDPGNAYWLPPGYPADPQIFFDLDADSIAYGSLAIGKEFSGNLRGEIAFSAFGKTDFAGPWSYTVPADPGPHADVSGSVRSVALMANGYYDFRTVGKVTPFVMAGIGISSNKMGEWTRTNAAATDPVRTFEGASKTNLAWSVGLGMSMDVGPVFGTAPAKLDVAWRYFDLGTARGGSVALAGSGTGGVPVAPLQFDVRTQVISLGLRIPL